MKTIIRILVLMVAVYIATAGMLIYACEPIINPPTSTDNGTPYDPNGNNSTDEMLPPDTTNITAGPVPNNTVAMQPTT